MALVLGAALISCSKHNNSSTAFRDRMYQNQDFLTSSYSGTTLSEFKNSEPVIVSEQTSHSIPSLTKTVTERQISNAVHLQSANVVNTEKILLQKVEKK